jgi:hypothetical protein
MDYLEQIDKNKYGIDIFGFLIYPCHIYKSYDYCCTLGNENGTIFALRFHILSGGICFIAKTLYQIGLWGLNFHLTLQNDYRIKE